jgi:CRISPR-associated protein Csy1
VTQAITETEEIAQLRTVIDGFLQERLQAKLEKAKDEEKRQKLIEDFKLENWIPDAARRVGQIQQITHALKYIHPDAKGTNLNSPGNVDAGELAIGTHTLAGEIAQDVVGNAAALDVYKFLRLEVQEKSLLARAIEADSALRQVLPSDDEQKQTWMEAFAGLVESKGEPASHKLAKQLYWPIGEDEFHLLAPMFPTSLVHHVWQTVRDDRFSEEAKAARDARREGKAHPHGYHEYPRIVIQQFGGTKPQNISQLNSERYGENYLLRSCPPDWVSEPVKPPLRVESVFDGWFGRRPEVKAAVRELRNFLYSLREDQNNFEIRNKRIELVNRIIEELLQFAAQLREIDSHWTALDECHLNMDEQCWFNPVRAESDEAFAKTYTWGDWKEAVCKRFANWLNGQLIKKKNSLPLSRDEAAKWERDLDKVLSMLRLEVEYD